MHPPPATIRTHNLAEYCSRAAKLGAAPLLFYLVFFFILTYPAVKVFPTHYYADGGDGLQNVWNVWWVNKAVTVLHQSPWHTNYLHYPYGMSLYCHNLTAFNGFVGILLAPFMTAVPVLQCHRDLRLHRGRTHSLSSGLPPDPVVRGQPGRRIYLYFLLLSFRPRRRASTTGFPGMDPSLLAAMAEAA